MSNSNVESHSVWGNSEPVEALRQAAKLFQEVVPHELKVSPDGSSFKLKSNEGSQRKGILSAHGEIKNDTIISIRIEMFKGPENARISSWVICNHFSKLGDKTQIISPPKESPGYSMLWLELKVKATPMTMSRSGAFLAELRNLDELARLLQDELPETRTDPELDKLYGKFKEILSPIHPYCEEETSGVPTLVECAHDIIDYLSSGCCVALSAPFSAVIHFALAELARIAQAQGKSFGGLLSPAIDPKGLVDLAGKAPGTVVVSAIKVSLGTSPYETGSEMQALLSSLTEANKPVLFTGRHEELQAVFHGGQGGTNDPLVPVLIRIPEVPIASLLNFMIHSSGILIGGLPKSAKKELVQNTLDVLQKLDPGEQRRILPLVARRAVNRWASSGETAARSSESFISSVRGRSETLAGLSPKPRVSRSSDVQERFTNVMSDPELLSFLKEYLFAQDRALGQLVNRLRMESLTRPPHQPIRYCAQGTPGTGKSESAILLAQRLGLPHMNIDAASMSDSHTAAAQLLGSGRGIVGSHQSGRLEKAAKHHTGVVVEISDLDHARNDVRSSLSDLFLQVMETGEAQSSTGAMFSCANLIFAFTMNLPGGMDENIRKGIGFNSGVSHSEVSKRVVSEIKRMLSSAFLSRIGTPILFEPLEGEAMAVILEHAIEKAIRSAADRLLCNIREIVLEENLGLRIISSLESNVLSFGARALLEHGRSMAAKAFVELKQDGSQISGKKIIVSATNSGDMIIKTL